MIVGRVVLLSGAAFDSGHPARRLRPAPDCGVVRVTNRGSLSAVADLGRAVRENNRRWAAETVPQRSQGSSPARPASSRPSTSGSAAPTAGCRPTRSSGCAGRAVRPPQRRQRRRAHRPELPVGDPVRGRRPAGKHVIVCGHYGCGGVLAALDGTRHGLIDNWLRHVQDVAQSTQPQLDVAPDEASGTTASAS